MTIMLSKIHLDIYLIIAVLKYFCPFHTLAKYIFVHSSSSHSNLKTLRAFAYQLIIFNVTNEYLRKEDITVSCDLWIRYSLVIINLLESEATTVLC